MVAQEYKNIIKQEYQLLFMPLNYQYSCEVYNNCIDIWCIDIKLNYLPSIYIPFIFKKFPIKTTMWYENDWGKTIKKIWKTN